MPNETKLFCFFRVAEQSGCQHQQQDGLLSGLLLDKDHFLRWDFNGRATTDEKQPEADALDSFHVLPLLETCLHIIVEF